MLQDATVKPYLLTLGVWEGLRSKEGKSSGGARQMGLVRMIKAISISQKAG